LGKNDSKGIPDFGTDQTLNKNVVDDDTEYCNIPWQEVIVFPNPDFNEKKVYMTEKEAFNLRKKCFEVLLSIFNIT